MMEHNKNVQGTSSNSCKRVHYAVNNEQEDNFTEGENYSAFSEVSKSSAKYTGDMNSEISVATSILDGEERDVRILRKKLEDYEYKIKYLEHENQEINANLINERVRASKLEKKLQFVKDNQEVFMRLKEAYINMKYNEAAGRKMIEIREKAVQTWQGVICGSCTESEELRRQIDVMIQKYKELFVVSPGEMEHLINTVKYLKDLIDRREKSWALNMEREHKFQNHIAILENENLGLKDQLAKKTLKVEDGAHGSVVVEKLERVLLEERKLEEMHKFVESVTKDMEKLKKIIVKYEKKFREIKEKCPLPYTRISPLNDKEIKIVQQIINKYNSKFQKSTEKLLETKTVSNDRVPVQSHRPSSPLRLRFRDDSGMRNAPERPRSARSYDRKAESAIMMMDCLFD